MFDRGMLAQGRIVQRGRGGAEGAGRGAVFKAVDFCITGSDPHGGGGIFFEFSSLSQAH